MENHENSMLENHENWSLLDVDRLHGNGCTIDEHIWSLLGDPSMSSTPVFATVPLATKSRVTFNENVGSLDVMPYSEIYGVHPKFLFAGRTRMVQKHGVCKWTGKTYDKLSKRILACNIDFPAIAHHRSHWIEIGNRCLVSSLTLTRGRLTFPTCTNALRPQALMGTPCTTACATSSDSAHSRGSDAQCSYRSRYEPPTSCHDRCPSPHGRALQRSNNEEPCYWTGASQRAAARTLKDHHQSGEDTKAKSDILC